MIKAAAKLASDWTKIEYKSRCRSQRRGRRDHYFIKRDVGWKGKRAPVHLWRIVFGDNSRSFEPRAQRSDIDVS